MTLHSVLARQGYSFCNRVRLNFQAFALRDLKMAPREGCRAGQKMNCRFSFCSLNSACRGCLCINLLSYPRFLTLVSLVIEWLRFLVWMTWLVKTQNTLEVKGQKTLIEKAFVFVKYQLTLAFWHCKLFCPTVALLYNAVSSCIIRKIKVRSSSLLFFSHQLFCTYRNKYF